MAYIRRKADMYLLDWKQNSNRKPLIVKGARQVGKTEAILHFARSNYVNVVYINFVEEPKYRSITSEGYSPATICKHISLINPAVKFVAGQTIILFDEIQDFPDIATSLKFFCIEHEYDVICSGSLLGINYQRIESNSVGYKVDYVMRSLDFEEFLWAHGYGDDVVDGMMARMASHQPFSTTEHDVFMSLFRDFAVVGGMPAIVCRHIENGTFEDVLDMQCQLMADYREDVRKYALGIEQTRILNVLNRVPVQLAAENKKFQISKVSHGAKSKDYWGCVEWLADAGVVNVCYCLNFPELPLKGNRDEARYKLYFADTGLLIAQLDDEAQYDLRVRSNLGTYKGGLFENIVAEALVKSGADLYYYKRQDSSLEEDFFMRTRTHIVPVEVKSTNGTAKSLRTLIDSERYPDIAWGIKLIDGNVGAANNILTLPYYCAFLLKRYLSGVE